MFSDLLSTATFIETVPRFGSRPKENRRVFCVVRDDTSGALCVDAANRVIPNGARNPC
jgi:hypothetical protein